MSATLSTVEIAGTTYRLGKLNAFQQFHVGRRMAPLIAVAGIQAAFLAHSSDGVPEGKAIEMFLPLLQPLSEVLSKMTDDDSNYVLNTCLGVCERMVGDRYSPVTAGGAMMFADIDLSVMMQLVVGVIRDNLLGFLMERGGNTP